MPAKRRLLVIDASDSARTILFKEIHNRAPDLDIIACGSIKEALTAVKRFEFEIITTGTTLPDGEGFELIDKIRQTPKNKDTAIFVVSGDTDTRVVSADVNDTDAVTAYFDKADGHRSLVDFILNFLKSRNEMPLRVIYVDKSATSTAVTTSILDRNNIDFVHFRDAPSAIDYLQNDMAKNGSCSLDVMITDAILTREMDGFALIRAIRNNLNLNFLTLPILLLTIEPAEDEKTDFTGIFGAGTNDFITKPVVEEDLLARLQTLVNIKRQSEALNP